MSKIIASNVSAWNIRCYYFVFSPLFVTIDGISSPLHYILYEIEALHYILYEIEEEGDHSCID